MALLILLLVVILALGTIVGVALYDLQEIKNQQIVHIHPYARKLRKRPLVSVIIDAKAPELLDQSQKNIIASSYRKLEIVNDIEHAHGEIVMKIDARHSLDKYAIMHAVQRFNICQDIDVLVPYNQIIYPYSMLALLQMYQRLLGNLHMKSKSSYGLPISDTSYIFRRQVSKKTRRVYYAHDVRISHKPNVLGLLQQPVIEQRPPAVWLHLPFILSSSCLALLAPFILSYFIYMAVALHQPTLLIITVILLSGFLLFGTWWDVPLSTQRKCIYSFLIPITFLPLYLWTFIHALRVILKVLTNMAKAKIPDRISFLVRVKDLLRVIK